MQKLETSGKFTDFRHPPGARERLVSDFEVRGQIEIQISKEWKLVKEEATIFECPRCRTSHPELEHGDAYRCWCSLKFRRFGNALYIWK